MSPFTFRSRMLAATVLLACAGPAAAQNVFSSGSTGADGALDLTTPGDTPIDLRTRPDGVFHYTTIDIGAGVRVRFIANAANTPVVWLASGDVNISGQVELEGASASGAAVPGNEAAGGPGGFRGGLGGRLFSVSGSYAGTPGQGPGGGLPGTASGQEGGGGGHATVGRTQFSGVEDARGGQTYGNRLLQPLLGGSGGGGGGSTDNADGGNGGGGGGAILIASSGAIHINSGANILARGGNGAFPAAGGSGGAIRLVANRVDGLGFLHASGAGGGGDGRIRIEAFIVQIDPSRTTPRYVSGPPLGLGDVAPRGTIRVASVAGQPVAVPPGGNTSAPDVVFTSAGPVTIGLQTTNIPSGTPLRVRVTARGQVINGTSSPTDPAGNASATLTVPAGLGTIEAYAEYVP